MSNSMKLPPRGHEPLKQKTVRTLVLRGVAYSERDVLHAIRNHVSLKGALEQMRDAVAEGNPQRLNVAMLAANAALRKTRAK